MTDTVTYDVENRIAWVRFNRPDKRNAMSPELNRRMMEVLDELELRDDDRPVMSFSQSLQNLVSGHLHTVASATRLIGR